MNCGTVIGPTPVVCLEFEHHVCVSFGSLMSLSLKSTTSKIEVSLLTLTQIHFSSVLLLRLRRLSQTLWHPIPPPA